MFMDFYSIEEWQQNWDQLIERVEGGEAIGVENDQGNRCVMVRSNDPVWEMYINNNNEAS